MDIDDQRAIEANFGREIFFQAQAALVFHEGMMQFLESADFSNNNFTTDLDNELTNAETVRIYLEALVNHSAALSRIFFSSKNLARSQHLRDLYDVADDSPISKRDLRNAFQHHDERIDASGKRMKKLGEEAYPQRLTYYIVDSAGNFKVQWHNGEIDFPDAVSLIEELKRLIEKAIQVLKLKEAQPPQFEQDPLPKGHFMYLEQGTEVITHEQYLKQTGQDPNMPYPSRPLGDDRTT
ncbi:hypothetical protein K7W42_18160 [Deinococcus sp. HMF7604]|uniref:hypothetical protein n=1 Tax=Deinococcus betulae TaxID=2873312 RepID=UPI001CC907E8|nr:hypothetical protein [Deinococcus betulae]MBZ9752768.1 hypothetical protein [Deinococcus betulae]